MATKQLSKQMLQRELAVYKGDEFVAMDTIENLAKLFDAALFTKEEILPKYEALAVEAED
ncbi:hypothetical protein EQG49_11110 [Periweissella cryptocerci]|uniref:Uncharacterized protein n=1 Tax=Periweissella cryptocerci TaxID=2506420 RepID=A0A4V1AIW8_9LACO|nr:hypothetical protein [Periweissella cryptocerci]QBO36955.1 hypothetical protein EQG49_11110 [Periweissella cryptocerci]